MILSSLLVSGALLTPRLHVTRPHVHVQRTCPVQMIGALDGLSDLLKKDEKPAAGERPAASFPPVSQLCGSAPDARRSATTGGGYFDVEQNAVRVQKYKDRVDRINAMEDEIELLEDEALAAKTQEFRSRLAAGATEDELLEEVFAVVREAAWRAIELRHYDVQLVGAMALHDGYLAGPPRRATWSACTLGHPRACVSHAG